MKACSPELPLGGGSKGEGGGPDPPPHLVLSLVGAKGAPEKLYCLRQGTSKRDNQHCGEIVHIRPTKWWKSQCRQAQNSAFGASKPH